MRVIRPKDRFEGEFRLNGDKSITHRALLLNGATEGEAMITNAAIGEDIFSTARVLRELGVKIEKDGSTFHVRGTRELLSGRELDCGNSGTTARLLTGLLAGKGVRAKLYGDSSLSARPMNRVAEPLNALGGNVQTTDGKLPVYVRPAPLTGTKIELTVPSAQVKSAVILAGLSASGETTVVERVKTRDHTERMLKAAGADLTVENDAVRVRKSEWRAFDVDVPSDISSAAYLAALGALEGKTLCKNVLVNPTRTGLLKAFDLLGVKYSLTNQRVSSGEEIADLLVEKSDLRSIEFGGDLAPSAIDELPLIALLCAFADGESRIYGAKELKYKESDRISATSELINALGGDCTATEDGFIIRGKRRLTGGDANAYSDHRIAMTAAVGLTASKNGGRIYGAESCAVSFPDFFEKIEK